MPLATAMRYLTLNGKRWQLREVPRLNADGECDAPTTRGKAIRIAARLRGERRLEVLIHEMLHACNWTIDEDHIAQTAADIARVLWRLGYRHPLWDSEDHGR